MKGQVISLLIFVAQSLFSQTADYKIFYDFHSVKDTMSMEHHRPEPYILYRVGDVSRFIHKTKYLADSLNQLFLQKYPDPSQSGAPITQELINRWTIKFHEHRSRFDLKHTTDFRVDKDFKTKETINCVPQSFPPKILQEVMNLKWIIIRGEDRYKGFSVQTATTTYGGRKYIAQFSPDIPINDGPYIFCGLPGLIVHIVDEEGWFKFELSEMYLEKSMVNFNHDFYANSKMLNYTEFVAKMISERTNPDIHFGVIEGQEVIKLKLIEERKDRFDFLIMRH